MKFKNLVPKGILGYLDKETVKDLIEKSAHISRKLEHFITYLKTIQHKGKRYAEEPIVEYRVEIDENNSRTYQTSN